MKYKNLVTTVLAGVFTMLAITGIMLFLEVENDFIEDIHGYIGITFAAVALLHLINNFSLLRAYLKKNKPLRTILTTILIVGIITLSLGFIFGEGEDGHDHDDDDDKKNGTSSGLFIKGKEEKEEKENENAVNKSYKKSDRIEDNRDRHDDDDDDDDKNHKD